MGLHLRRKQGINLTHVNRDSEEVQGRLTSSNTSDVIYEKSIIDYHTFTAVVQASSTALQVQVDVSYADPRDIGDGTRGRTSYRRLAEETIARNGQYTLSFNTIDTGIAQVRVTVNRQSGSPPYRGYFRAFYIEGSS